MDFKSTIHYKNNIFTPYIGLGAIICIMAYLSALANSTSVLEATLFCVFQILCLLVPGMALKNILRIRELTVPENLLLCYVLGYCANIGIYFFVMLTGLDEYVKVVFLFAAVLSIVSLVVKKPENAELSRKESRILLLILFVLFIYTLIVFSRNWSLPVTIKEYKPDLLFWIGDAVSLKKQFLPLNFRFLWEDYKYHYFGAMQIAIMSMATEISVFKLAIYYSYIESVIFLGLSAYCLFRRMIKKDSALFFTLFLVFFSTGLEQKSIVTYIWHIHLLPMSYTIAYSMEMFIILLLFIQNSKKELDRNIIAISVIAIIVCTGLKGPAGAIVLCGIGFMCIYWFFIKKDYIKAIVYGGANLLAFSLIYFSLLHATNQVYTLPDNTTAAAAVTVEAVEAVVQEAPGYIDIAMGYINNITEYAKYYLYLNPWTFIPAISFIIFGIIKKKVKVEDIILFGMILVGTILGFSLVYTGQSEMYFSLSVFAFAAVLAGRLLDNLLVTKYMSFSDRSYKPYIIFGILSICILIFSLQNDHKGKTYEFFKVGLLNRQYSQELYDQNKTDIMSKAEYEAYEWLRNNSEEDCLVLSDRMLAEGIGSNIPGAFSERYVYYYYGDELEMGNLCYQGDYNAIKYFQNQGVRYILASKFYSPEFECPEDMGAKIFENEAMKIFELYM